MKNFENINKVLGVERLESLKGSVSLHTADIKKLDTALKNVAPANSIKTSEIKADTANFQNKLADIKNETALFRALLNSIHPVVAAQETMEKKIEAVNALLAAKPGVQLDNYLNDMQPQSKEEILLAKDLQAVNWDQIDSLEHNKRADQFSDS